MLKKIMIFSLIVCLGGCAIPVSNSCIDSQRYEHPDANFPAKESKCTATDAAVYVIAATLQTLENENKKTNVEGTKAVKCSDMVGRSQKACVRKEKESYDPLDEL